MIRGAITSVGLFSSCKLNRILSLSLSRWMHIVLGPKFSVGVLANLVLTHEESMESKMEIISCKAPMLPLSWIGLMLRWGISLVYFPSATLASLLHWELYFCSLLEGPAPRYLCGSLLCFLQVCTQIPPSSRGRPRSPIEIVPYPHL